MYLINHRFDFGGENSRFTHYFTGEFRDDSTSWLKRKLCQQLVESLWRKSEKENHNESRGEASGKKEICE